MSAKARSDALRKILAQNIEQSAATPAPLTLTGAGTVPVVSESHVSVKVTPKEVMTPETGVLLAEDRVLAPASVAAAEMLEDEKTDDSQHPTPTPSPLANAVKAIAPVLPRQEPIAIPRPEKLSVLLGASELAILERFHEDARGAGIKMRKGGNPSLFVRAALRLLDQVGAQNVDEWARIVAGSLHDVR